jgi:hypothetical protein
VLEFLPPPSDRWRWADRVSNRIVTVPLAWRPQQGRHEIELGGVPDHPFKALFDRLIVTNAGIDITRLRMPSRAFDLRQPLSAAIGANGHRVTDVLPGMTTMIGMAAPPFEGVVVRSDVREAGESTWSRLTQWELQVAIRGRDGTVAIRARWRWLKDLGLASYSGDVYGSAFRYDHHPRLQFDGVWVAPARGVVFTFAQQGRAVTGGFTHAGFTGELTGTFDRHTIAFEWSIIGATRRGRGELKMDEDGLSLRGHFGLNGDPADWLLLHAPPPAAAPPITTAGAAAPDLAAVIRSYHSRGGDNYYGSGVHTPFSDWASRTRRQIWDLTAERGQSGQASEATEGKIAALRSWLRAERERAYGPDR